MPGSYARIVGPQSNMFWSREKSVKRDKKCNAAERPEGFWRRHRSSNEDIISDLARAPFMKSEREKPDSIRLKKI